MSVLMRKVGDEITIVGSFSEMNKFPAAIDYLDSGKVKVKGIVNKVFKIEEWEQCLEAMRNKSAIKAAIVPHRLASMATGLPLTMKALKYVVCLV